MACELCNGYSKMHKLVGLEDEILVELITTTPIKSHGTVTSTGHRHIFDTHFVRFVETYYR